MLRSRSQRESSGRRLADHALRTKPTVVPTGPSCERVRRTGLRSYGATGAARRRLRSSASVGAEADVVRGVLERVEWETVEVVERLVHVATPHVFR
jgi:hypothetical protein